MLRELFLKAALIDIQSVFFRDFAREVERKAERVGKAEYVRAGEDFFPCCFGCRHEPLEQIGAGLDRRVEALLLHAHDFLNIV